MNINFTIFLITIYIFLDNLGYSIFEFKNNNNKLGAVFIIILNLAMIIGVNYFMFNFN